MITEWCKLGWRPLSSIFSAMIFISILLGLIGFSDIVNQCCIVGQIVVANKTLSVLIYYLYACFHEGVAMTVKQI